MFPLFVVKGYFTHSLLQAEGHLSVVRDATADALVVFEEMKASFFQGAVHIMPGSMEKEIVFN